MITPNPTLDERRDKLAKEYFERTISDSGAMGFVEGWDACRAEMQTEIESKKLIARTMENSNRKLLDEIERQKSHIKFLEDALYGAKDD